MQMNIALTRAHLLHNAAARGTHLRQRRQPDCDELTAYGHQAHQTLASRRATTDPTSRPDGPTTRQVPSSCSIRVAGSSMTKKGSPEALRDSSSIARSPELLFFKITNVRLSLPQCD